MTRMRQNRLLFKKEEEKSMTPRAHLDPRSRDYALQTVEFLKLCLESQRIEKKRIDAELAKIEKYRHWEVLGYPDKDSLLKDKVGMGSAEIDERTRQADETPKVVKSGSVGRGRNRVDNIKPNHQGGTGQSYLLGRMKRVAPEIVQGWVEGKYPSVRQAAIAAGIVKVPTPLQAALKAYNKLSDSDKAEFLRLIGAR